VWRKSCHVWDEEVAMPLTNGLVVMTPTSVAKTGTGSTATINSDGSVVFDLCTTLSLNGVFTSSYDNYMIVMRATTSLAWPYFNSRLRASGTDNTTASSYTNQYLTANGTTVSAGSGSDNRWFYVLHFWPEPCSAYCVSGSACDRGTWGRILGICGYA
jgi:hypothetical protein